MIPASRRRLFVLYLLVAAMLVALGGRLWYLQVMDGTQYKQLAAANQTREVVVPAVRGEILDDEGNPLVSNQSSLVVSVNMSDLSQTPDGGQSVLRRLASLLGMSYTLLSDKVRLCTKGVPAPCWTGSPYQPVPVDQQVSVRTALQIMEEPTEFPGVTAQVQPVVDYPMPDGANPAQVLGYLQPITQQEMAQDHLPETGYAEDDLVGQAGLEAQYNTALTGKPGTETVSVNAAGDVTGTVGETAPVNGDTLVTSINSKVQALVQTQLADAIARSRAEGNDVDQGAAIVETTTGRIVAMASYPDYDPSVWTSGISESEFNYLFGASSGTPVINWATQGQYSPGSTFKVTSTAAAIADGYPLDGLYDCPASISIDGQTFINDGEPSLGYMSLAEALIQSCDTVFYNIGYQMWQTDDNQADFEANPNAPTQKMQQMELDWGFGQYTGIDLPEESTGTIPTRQWLYDMWKDNANTGEDWCKNGKANGTYVQQIEYDNCQNGFEWEPGQAAIAAIGQGYVTVTPLQLANAYVALANGGTLYAPKIGEALLSPSGKVVERINPTVVRKLPVASSTLAYIRTALQGVVTSGTAAGAFAGFPLNQVCVAGKTGTAQIMGKVATSVFASFAPCQDPKLVVLVMLPDSGYGADAAAPAVRAIWDGIYGLEGDTAALPGGQLPTTLPKVTR
ncbi:penicillin-binding protein 2 [Trebonia sp.]|uniref:penicillin-binding protein 2 n=1 Tax=Trebonia sp. TaxID=2767075 RepID=UPI00260B5EDE|nr:penicillin-binding protein 2 [Trebonia sp.]